MPERPWWPCFGLCQTFGRPLRHREESAWLLQPQTSARLMLVGHGVMPSLLIWTGPPPPRPRSWPGGSHHTHLWLWLPAFSSSLYPAFPGWTGPDDHAHKDEGGDARRCHPQSLLSIVNNRGEGKAGGKPGLAGQDATLVDGNRREKVAGRGGTRRWCWYEHKQPHTRQEHTQAATERVATMPWGLVKTPVGSAGANPQVSQEKTTRRIKTKQEKRGCAGDICQP